MYLLLQAKLSCIPRLPQLDFKIHSQHWESNDKIMSWQRCLSLRPPHFILPRSRNSSQLPAPASRVWAFFFFPIFVRFFPAFFFSQSCYFFGCFIFPRCGGGCNDLPRSSLALSPACPEAVVGFSVPVLLPDLFPLDFCSTAPC